MSLSGPGRDYHCAGKVEGDKKNTISEMWPKGWHVRIRAQPEEEGSQRSYHTSGTFSKSYLEAHFQKCSEYINTLFVNIRVKISRNSEKEGQSV